MVRFTSLPTSLLLIILSFNDYSFLTHLWPSLIIHIPIFCFSSSLLVLVSLWFWFIKSFENLEAFLLFTFFFFPPMKALEFQVLSYPQMTRSHRITGSEKPEKSVWLSVCVSGCLSPSFTIAPSFSLPWFFPRLLAFLSSLFCRMTSDHRIRRGALS